MLALRAQPQGGAYHDDARLETVALGQEPVSRRGEISHRRLLGVHAAATPGAKTLRASRGANVFAGLSLGLARHRVRREAGAATGIAAPGWAFPVSDAPSGAGRSRPRDFQEQTCRKSLLAGGAAAEKSPRPRTIRRSAAGGPFALPGRQ